MTPGPGFVLDHVAVATPEVSEILDYLVGTLGGVVMFGDQGIGFRPMQVRIGGGETGMTVELIEPWRTDGNDFLARFLESNGPGPHHITFKVPDFSMALERVRRAGYTPVAVNDSNPSWKELFLHPKEAHGTVIQLAESHDGFDSPGERLEHLETSGPDRYLQQWWPDPPQRAPDPACLQRVVVNGADLDALQRLYVYLLGGTPTSCGTATREIAWPYGARIRLVSRDGPPGVERLEFAGGTDLPETTVAGTCFAPTSDVG